MGLVWQKWDPVDADWGPGWQKTGPVGGPASKKWDAVTTQMGLVWEKRDPVGPR